MIRQFLIRMAIMLAVATGLILDPWTLAEGIVGTLIASLVAAVFLRAAAHWVEKRRVPYGDAYLTMALAGIANLVVGIVLHLVIVRLAGTSAWDLSVRQVQLVFLFAWVSLGFFVQSVVVGSRLGIGFGRGALLVLVMMAITFVMTAIVVAIAFALMRAYGWEGFSTGAE